MPETPRLRRLITPDEPYCRDCLSAAAAVSRGDLDAHLLELAAEGSVSVFHGTCVKCGGSRLVIRRAACMTERARILVIEDVGTLRDLFHDALDPARFEVDTAATASQALAHLAAHRYAVIIADCLLPGLSVVDWLTALRGAAPTIPLVLESGRAGPQELARYAAQFRAAAVLEKPFSVTQLLAAVNTALEMGSAKAEAPGPPS